MTTGTSGGHTQTSVTASTEVELFSIAGRDGFLREVNESFADLIGKPLADVAGRSLLELVHPDDTIGIVTGLAALETGAAEVLFESRFMQHDGGWAHLQWVARTVPGTDLWWAAGRNVSQFHQLLAEQLGLRAQLDLAIGNATAVMWEYDFGSDRFSWEPQAAQIMGIAPEAVPAGTEAFAAVAHPDDVPALLLALAGFAASGAAEVELRTGTDLDLRHLSLRGKVLDRDRRGRALRAVGIVVDVTTEKAMQEQMLRMVMADALTGVANRRAFDQALRTEWRRNSRSGTPLSVLMIDIDDFKNFNDTFGHLVGDEALCAVARVLATAVHRAGDVLARFGGEEFAAVLPDTDEGGAQLVAIRMVTAIREIVLRQAPGRPLTISIGTVTWHPGTSVEPVKSGVLLSRADQAVYAAKAAGKNQVIAYETSIAGRDRFEAAIARALTQGEFELHYQPLIDLRSGDACGFEALIRWQRPGHGMVEPDDFIPAAEASDLICGIGRWALHEAACQLARWQQAGIDPDQRLSVAVNVSGRHVSSQAIVADIEDALSASGIAADRLEVELTETALIDHAVAGPQLSVLRALDVLVAIDDFGTGYTSVSQLPRLAADVLKIDRSFIASTDPRHRALVELMVGAAHAFGLSVVAEGVEDAATLQFLTAIGCDCAQGYLIGRPMPAGQVPGWLAEWRAGAGRPGHDAPGTARRR